MTIGNSQKTNSEGWDRYWADVHAASQAGANGGVNNSQDVQDKAARGEYGDDVTKLRQDQDAGKEGDLTNHDVAHNPGAAVVGGYDQGGEDIRNMALSGMHAGDAAYAGNEVAMNNSIANMKQDRGEMSPENASLLAREASTRKAQMGALDMQRDAAMGGAPSAASFQTLGAMDANMAGQAGAAGAARGLSALGSVQSAGAQGVGQNASNIAMSGGMGRSKEMAEAMGMYGSNSGIARQGDLERLTASDTNALGNAELNNNWRVSNANLAAKQGQLGVEQDKMRGAWYDASTEPARKQAEFDQTMQGMKNGMSAGDAASRVARNREQDDKNRAMGGNLAAAGLTGLGSMAGPGGTVVGGMAGSYVNGAIR